MTASRIILISALASILASGCAKDPEDLLSQSIEGFPQFEKGGVASRFLEFTSKGPVQKSVCTDLDGTLIAPIEFEDPKPIGKGILMYRHKATGKAFAGVYFVTERAVTMTLHVCAWPQA